MKRTQAIAVVVVLIAALAAGYWYWSKTRGGGAEVDLVEAFRGAEKRSNMPATLAFAMEPQTVKGVARPSIFMHPTSRVTYKLVVPEGGHLRAWLALKEGAWDKSPDGVLFRIAISKDGNYTELLNRQVNPTQVAADRDWVPVDLDLSRWAGGEVQLIFNTNTSPPNQGDNNQYDWAIIGSPAVVIPSGQ